ncbi:hydrogenase maturation protein [Scytonema hofmannii PCC 7110]|uniref:Hydrogenase maturation protein n=1 Tax=Scytonema hofmannii PCC 7110 TaxID=128403 RepID=A0A139WQL7_9CYAN|nr:enoyl-CoA hydratase-related protein [Scytonema hofmannii]KYC34714.1 hydrogenase maturation protein [Scytonema hofmannii PCC 7110]
MKILIIAPEYNSLIQRTYVELVERGHDISIELAINDRVMIEATELYQPYLIIAPMLKTAIPKSIWSKHTCIIIHVGIKGNRASSLLQSSSDKQEWNVTALQASASIDTSPVWSTRTLKLRRYSEGFQYSAEVTQAVVKTIVETVKRYQGSSFVPIPNSGNANDYLSPYTTQSIRTIKWQLESTKSILKKIREADREQVVLDTIEGQQYYLYGAHEETSFKGKPGQIIATRNGAICRATTDGAIWITHLKKKSNIATFKLPATLVLKDHLQGVPEIKVPLTIPSNRKTYREIWYEEKDSVGYLHFDFYNGAMSTEQCERLRLAYVCARNRNTKVIVLMGGQDFWSNGIDFNTIEAASDPIMQSWDNINAMNDLVREIITTKTHLTIAAMHENAVAGGVMLALAADKVYCRSGIILNPHYKQMGLYGSEYWTYLLPRRVGAQKAFELAETCLPIGTRSAKKIGLIHDFFGESHSTFTHQIELIASELSNSHDYHEQLSYKIAKRAQDEFFKPLERYRTDELNKIMINLRDPAYHDARRNFVYKIAPSQTPLYLAKHRSESSQKCVLIAA